MAWQTKGISVGRKSTGGHSLTADHMRGEQSESWFQAPSPLVQYGGSVYIECVVNESKSYILTTLSYNDAESMHPGAGNMGQG